MPERGWYEVQAAVDVYTTDEKEAIAAITTRLRSTYRDGAALYAVAVFNATPTEDPTKGPGRGPTLKADPALRELVTRIRAMATEPTAGHDRIESPLNRLAGIAEEIRVHLGEPAVTE